MPPLAADSYRGLYSKVLLCAGVDNEKVGVDNKQALELDNRIFFFIFHPNFNIEISPKNATKHPVA